MRFSWENLMIRAALLPFLLAGVAGGCVDLERSAAEPTRFYVLASSAGAAIQEEEADPALDRFDVRIEGVQLPEYLQTPAIAVRVAANEVEFTDLHRWAEPVSAGLVRVLKENIETFAGIRTVQVAPFRRGEGPAYSLRVSVRRFEGDRSGADGARTCFDVVWSLSCAANGRRVDGRHRSVEPWDGESFGFLATAFSRSALELSRTLVEEMRRARAREGHEHGGRGS